MKLFHRTSRRNADSILRHGFRDSAGSYMMVGATVTGVWVSNRPLDENEGARGDVVLEIRLRISRRELGYYEVKEEDKPYREWCFPAALLNRRSTTEERKAPQ